MKNKKYSDITVLKHLPATAGERQNHLRVLTYHRISRMNHPANLDPRLISATPKVFAEQMLHLKMNYNVVSVNEVMQACVNGERLPSRAVLITFDDAYNDFAEQAWPVMRELRLSATLFVPTGYPDRPDRHFWWDRLFNAFISSKKTSVEYGPLGVLPLDLDEDRHTSFHQVRDHIKSLPFLKTLETVDMLCEQLDCARFEQKNVLNWDELRALAKEGVCMGAHTRSHSILTDLPKDRIRREVRTSQRDMRKELGDYALPVFSYPNGNCDDQTAEIVRESGFLLGFSNGLTGLNKVSSSDLMQLHRMNITVKNTLPVFKLRLRHWFNYIDQIRYRRQQVS